jgi:alkanesulfonate monooxygenase SsuD/methylene tetrahydromethanopterin reductase-like flavin-dependent oxidoreductase (luciferase family)
MTEERTVPAGRRADELQRAGNPLYNDRKLKLGTFGSNLDRGCAISTIDGVLEINWPNTLTLAKLADEMEFEALVPVGRWKGFGGVTNFNGPGFETFSWAAGIGACTRNSTVFATSHVLTVHPIMAAKQAATIDHITGGRFALNVVTGWHRPEMEMFGAPLMEHDARYGLAVEWLEVIKLLWTAEEEFDYEGKHFKIAKGYLEPKPLQKPFPAVMNAGSSETGRDYAAKYCDVAFVNTNRGDFDSRKALIESYRRLAREEYGRELQIWSHAYIVQGETEQEAKDYHHEYVHEKGDWVAATNLVETMGLNTQGRTQEALRAMKMHFIGGWGGLPLIGTKEQVVDGLVTMSKLGLDGVVVSWPRYIDDMRTFQRETLPLLKQAGLR